MQSIVSRSGSNDLSSTFVPSAGDQIPFTLLIVEDDKAELNRLERAFVRLEPRAKIVRASTPVAACNQFRKHLPEVVILDLGLTGHGPQSGLEVISKISGIDPTSRIVTLTGYAAEEVGAEAVKNGSASFLMKPVSIESLHTVVLDCLQTARLKRLLIESQQASPLEGFIGNSAVMRNVYRLIRQCAGSDSNVLVVGETGTGKELVVKAIHNLSSRNQQNLSVYFGSAPGSMAESELFGYVRGAFTGASSHGTEGSIKRANCGTLFIDELCSLDLDIQRKLLRVIEEKTFKPLGSDQTQRSDFRLVCAAQPRIYDFVRTGHFREDLLGRVEVITINLPPLRERREDILPLAESFQRSAKEEMRRNNLPCSVWGFTKEATRAIREYSWPRNIRELKHAVQNAMVQAQLRGSEKIDFKDLVMRFEDRRAVESSEQGKSYRELIKPGTTLREAMEKVEQVLIVDSLKRHHNSLAAVCQELGVGRTTLWRKLRLYDLGEPRQ